MKEYIIELLYNYYFYSFFFNNKRVHNYINAYNNNFIYNNASYLYNDFTSLWLALIDSKWFENKDDFKKEIRLILDEIIKKDELYGNKFLNDLYYFIEININRKL